MSWLWKGDSTSPASFEKALSKLSTQITSANLALDTTRSRARRFNALWTLYTTLTYLLFTLIITLVLGPQNWSLPHYAGLIASPVVIYGIRRLITLFFDWRISRQQAYVDDIQKQRDVKIADLKKATKYDSTQELLQKYGASPAKQQNAKQSQQGTKRKINPPPEQMRPARTGLPPPPTANISGRGGAGVPFTPERQNTGSGPTSSGSRQSPLSSMSGNMPAPISPDEPGFAPNAFANAPVSATPAYESAPHWYDRILDVMLGEDETAAKNRLALICTKCRLVNGQAPPGVRTLEEIGKWRCSSCGAWNGVESENVKVVKEILEKSKPENGDEWEKVSKGDAVGEETTQEDQIDDSILEADSKGPDTPGRDEQAEANITKRVTRSSKQEP